MRTVAAFVISGALISPSLAQAVHDVQDAITCEAWTDSAKLQSKLVTQISDWIVHEMRKEAVETARAPPFIPCGDLRCLRDEKLLTTLNEWCVKSPAMNLREAIGEVSLFLNFLQGEAERSRQDAEEERQNSK
jgi:hypothetical protein